MPFQKQLNPEIDQTTGATIVVRYTLPLVQYGAYNNYSRLEIIFAKAFVKGLKRGNYSVDIWTLCRLCLSSLVSLNFTHHAAYKSSGEDAGNISTDTQLAKQILAEL